MFGEVGEWTLEDKPVVLFCEVGYEETKEFLIY